MEPAVPRVLVVDDEVRALRLMARVRRRARLTGQHLSVTSLALSSKSPMTTALRRIEDLIEGGLAARSPG